MWAYGTDLSSDYPKVSEFKKVLLTLDDPLSLKEALEMMKSDVATTISSPLVSDGEKDEIKPSEEKNSSITTTANKITPPITEKSDATISASLPNLPTKAPVDPVVITLHTATTTSTLPTTIPLAVVSEYFKSDSLPEVEKTSLPPVEPVVPKKPAIATDEQRTSASVDVSPSFPLNSVVDATEIPERSSIEINKKQEAFAEKTIVGKAKEKEVIDEYKSDEQHGRAKPKSSSGTCWNLGSFSCMIFLTSEGRGQVTGYLITARQIYVLVSTNWYLGTRWVGWYYLCRKQRRTTTQFVTCYHDTKNTHTPTVFTSVSLQFL